MTVMEISNVKGILWTPLSLRTWRTASNPAMTMKIVNFTPLKRQLMIVSSMRIAMKHSTAKLVLVDMVGNFEFVPYHRYTGTTIGKIILPVQPQ